MVEDPPSKSSKWELKDLGPTVSGAYILSDFFVS